MDAADPKDRAFKLATICVCVVSVGYLAHNPRIVTRMVELRVIIILFFGFNETCNALYGLPVVCRGAGGGGAMVAVG